MFPDFSGLLFEDNHLVAVNKPAGLMTQPAQGHGESLEEQLKEYIKRRESKPGGVFLHAVHRLDRVVSGVVLFAKSRKSLIRLNEQMRKRALLKTYLAVIEGCWDSREGTLRHYLVHDSWRARESHAEDPEASEAVLSYRVVAKQSKRSLVVLRLETGRYHQIRIQLALVGHPIRGDVKYGAMREANDSVFLHHHLMALQHPVTLKDLCFRAPVPAHWPLEKWFPDYSPVLEKALQEVEGGPSPGLTRLAH